MIDSRRAMLLVVAGLLLPAGCGRAEKRPGAPAPGEKAGPPKRAEKVRVESRGLRELSWQEDGKYIMRASAGRLTGEEQGKLELRDARVTLYREGSEAVKVSAPVISADTQGKTLAARDGVVVDSIAGDTRVTVGSLLWRYREGKMIGEGGVRVSSSLGEVTGDRLVADTKLDRVVLYSGGGGRASLNAAAAK